MATRKIVFSQKGMQNSKKLEKENKINKKRKEKRKCISKDCQQNWVKWMMKKSKEISL